MSGIRRFTVQVETSSGDDDYDLIGAMEFLAETIAADGHPYMITVGEDSSDDVFQSMSADFDPDWDYKR